MQDEGFLYLVLVGVFLVLSGFFSSSEAAFLSVQRTRIAHLVSEGVPGARRVADMIGNPERLLATILLGNNIVNTALAAVVTVTFVTYAGEDNQEIAIAAATVVSTTVLVILGEIIPKSIAVRKAEPVAVIYSYPLKWTEYLLWPFVVLLQWLTRGVNSLLGSSRDQPVITEGEFRTLIDIGEAEGEFEPAEAEMLENVFQFGDRQVREVMTPRTEMVSIRRGSSLSEFLDIYSKNSHTRFPVYRDAPDNVVGVISIKDVLRHMSQKELGPEDPITDAIRDGYFVPETKRISELFDELRTTGSQMALVIDEFGGLAGLVTLKRLLEVVMGPVGEEGESPEEEYRAIDENTFHVEGGMGIEEVNQEIGIELPDGEYETLAGFVLDVLGHIPTEGEQFDFNDMKFEILEMQDLKIEEVRVTKSTATTSEAAGEADSGQTRRD